MYYRKFACKINEKLLQTNINIIQQNISRVCVLTLSTCSVAGCRIGHYGKNCVHNCSTNCNVTRRCDRVTGQCEGGCITGWTGSICNQRKFFFFLLLVCGYC